MQDSEDLKLKTKETEIKQQDSSFIYFYFWKIEK
jgi:hypothetical protein